MVRSSIAWVTSRFIPEDGRNGHHLWLIFLGFPVVIMLCILVVPAFEWASWHAESFTYRWNCGLDRWRARNAYRSFDRQDRAAFLGWLSSRAGASTVTGAVDGNILEAQRQSELIRILLDAEVPKAVNQCVRTHRLIAQISGAWHLAEIQFEPEPYALRTRTVWVLKHTCDLLQNYPFKYEDPRTLHNSIVIRKQALPTCSHCPYIELPVQGLPELCPTAALFQPRGGDHVACP